MMIAGCGSRNVNASCVLPWIGWNSGELSFLLVAADQYGRRSVHRSVSTSDMYVEITRLWWDRFAASEDWAAAAALGKECTLKRPQLAYGWENWAWALHKCRQTREAYSILAPSLKQLKLPGPPSGRSAYCLACFCGAMGKQREASRWLRLAYAMATDKDVFKDHVIHEVDLREVWPGMPQFAETAMHWE